MIIFGFFIVAQQVPSELASAPLDPASVTAEAPDKIIEGLGKIRETNSYLVFLFF